MRSAALAYAKRGLPVLPLWWIGDDGRCACGRDGCGSPGKHPHGRAVPRGVDDATSDAEIVSAWWSEWPRANIGLAMGSESGLLTLDIDSETPGEGRIAELAAEHGGLPRTLTARTGGGGTHYVFRFDAALRARLAREGREIKSKAGIGVRGVDVRSERARGGKLSRGFIVAAPSLHESGRRYEWIHESDPADLPEWVYQLITTPIAGERQPWAPPVRTDATSSERTYIARALDSACAEIAGCGTGGRHEAICRHAFTIAGYIAGGAPMDPDEAAAALIQAGLAAYGGHDDGVTRAVRDAFRDAPEKPLPWPPRGWRGGTRGAEPPQMPEDVPPPTDEDAPRAARSSLRPDDYHQSSGAADDDSGFGPPPGAAAQIEAHLAERRLDLGDGGYRMTDLGNAEELFQLHGSALRWCGAMPGEGWLVWDGRRWAPDETRSVVRLTADVAAVWRSRATECTTDKELRKALTRHAAASESARSIRAMLELAKAHRSVAVRRDALDADPMLFNCQNVTINLTTGKFHKHRQADLLTKAGGTSYRPRAACPTWLAFLNTVMGGDQELVAFLQRAVGYSLTGRVSEQCLFILHGTGANGKSTFIEAIRFILGDYAKNTPIETFTMKREGGIPNDLAALAGARLVTASESQEGMALNEGLVKLATGDDVITARYLNREFFDYEPAFKVWLSTNHKPIVKGTDNGIWRRLRLIPFTVTIPPERRDKGLKDKLRAEAPGILAWALEGCAQWHAAGLQPPRSVLDATEAYRSEMDLVGSFLDECCDLGEQLGPTSHKALYAAFLGWCRENGAAPRSGKWFAQQLTQKGVAIDPRNGAERQRTGVALRRPFADGWHVRAA